MSGWSRRMPDVTYWGLAPYLWTRVHLDRGTPEIKRGPVFPGLLGFFMAFFGRNTESLAWCVRLLALANPLLAYFLVKRMCSPVAGLITAVLVTLLSYTATNPEAFNIDAVLLTMNLLTLLTLMA